MFPQINVWCSAFLACLLFFVLCVQVLYLHVHKHVINAQGGQKRGSRGTGITFGCEPLCGYWELNPGLQKSSTYPVLRPRADQQVLEPSKQPLGNRVPLSRKRFWYFLPKTSHLSIFVYWLCILASSIREMGLGWFQLLGVLDLGGKGNIWSDLPRMSQIW